MTGVCRFQPTQHAVRIAPAAFAVIVWGVALAAASETPARPNVVLILADDLGYGDINPFGQPPYTTPALDRMAQQGARLTHFYTPVPFCAPTRGSLLTGRYPFRHGVTGNPTPDAGINDLGIADSEVLLGEAFQAAGYATAMVGKWHLGHRPEFYPVRHGFQEYLGILYSNDMRPVQLVENDRVIEYPLVQATLTRRYTDRAVDFIERHKDVPFFLYLAHAMPHKPLAPSEAYYRKSPGGLYGDVLQELDAGIGEVMEKLRSTRLDERTIVVFTSDNGPWFGGSTGGLRGMKGSTFEGGIRVPLIARWPGRIPAGHVSASPAGIIDLFPTLLKAAGIDLPKDVVLDGRDIMPLLTSDAPSPHQALFAMAGGARLMAIRSGRWKLHVRPPGPDRVERDPAAWVDPRGPDGVTILAPYEQYRPERSPGSTVGVAPKPMMLFDLEADPAETRDVSSEHPDVVARLAKAFEMMEKEIPPGLNNGVPAGKKQRRR